MNRDASTIFLHLGIDIVSILSLLFLLFYRRHRRPDLVAISLACNIGVFSLLTVLSFSRTSSAIGFALFGVLSIIRLRSVAFEVLELSYFFLSLAIALNSAIHTTTYVIPLALNLVIFLTMAFVDSPSFRSTSEFTEIILDRIITDPVELKAHVEEILGGTVLTCEPKNINFLQETLTLSVVYCKSE
jgi:hypothetical protein